MTTVDQPTTFGSELKRYRKAANYSLAVLASRLPRGEHEKPVLTQSISDWERDAYLPRRREIVASLEEVLDVPDHQLLRLAGFIVDRSDHNTNHRLDRIERRLDWTAVALTAVAEAVEVSLPPSPTAENEAEQQGP